MVFVVVMHRVTRRSNQNPVLAKGVHPHPFSPGSIIVTVPPPSPVTPLRSPVPLCNSGFSSTPNQSGVAYVLSQSIMSVMVLNCWSSRKTAGPAIYFFKFIELTAVNLWAISSLSIAIVITRIVQVGRGETNRPLLCRATLPWACR